MRVLVSGRLCVSTTTFTEHVVGRVESKSVSYPLPPLFIEGQESTPGVPPRFADEPKKTRVVGVENWPDPKEALGPIPVTEIRDGDVLVVTVDLLGEEQADEYRAAIRKRLLPVKVDVLLMTKPGQSAISHILRPADRVEAVGGPHAVDLEALSRTQPFCA